MASRIVCVFDGPAAVVLARTDSTGANSFLRNALGSTLALTDSNGSIQTQYSYDPFGGSMQSGPTTSGTYAYTGRELDTAGLYFYRARYYNPQTGRFISEDPAGFAGGINMYVYAHNDPINGSDPSGLWDTYTHHKLLWNALRGCGMSNADIWQLQEESNFQDAWQFGGQDPGNAYKHSMASPFQSSQDALNAINGVYCAEPELGGRDVSALWRYCQFIESD